MNINMKVPLKEVNSNDTDRSLGWALLTPGTVNYLLTGTKSFTYLSEVCVTHARTELMVISWLLVCYQHIFTLRVSELLQTSRGPDWDQMWIFSCNSCRNCYRLHTLCLPVQTLSLYTRHQHGQTIARLVTFPIIKDLQTFTQRQLTRIAAVYLAMEILNCVGIYKSWFHCTATSYQVIWDETICHRNLPLWCNYYLAACAAPSDSISI